MKKLIIALLLITLLFLGASCKPTKIEPAEAEIGNFKIPADYSTYTYEGLFSISYPQSWVPATSVMEDLFEQAKDWLEDLDPESYSEDTSILFLGGIPTLEGYYPSVTIVVMPRSLGYWALDEIVEAEHQWSLTYEAIADYREISRTRTNIGGLEAIVCETEDNYPEYGEWRYMLTYVCKGSYAWLVTCASENVDFNKYKGTFENIANSFEILK